MCSYRVHVLMQPHTLWCTSSILFASFMLEALIWFMKDLAWRASGIWKVFLMVSLRSNRMKSCLRCILLWRVELATVDHICHQTKWCQHCRYVSSWLRYKVLHWGTWGVCHGFVASHNALDGIMDAYNDKADELLIIRINEGVASVMILFLVKTMVSMSSGKCHPERYSGL